MVMNFLYVAIGGAIGACLRYGVMRLIPMDGNSVPVATLAVNIIGCALAGLLTGWFHSKGQPTDIAYSFLFIGLLGGFTTFSAFSSESVALLDRGETLSFMVYASLSFILCVGAFAAARGTVISWLS